MENKKLEEIAKKIITIENNNAMSDEVKMENIYQISSELSIKDLLLIDEIITEKFLTK